EENKREEILVSNNDMLSNTNVVKNQINLELVEKDNKVKEQFDKTYQNLQELKAKHAHELKEADYESKVNSKVAEIQANK
ncbi:MAG: hypothetical protein ACOZBL_05340, partial [Patescibacteria group bacterium]